jgi:general secretion pathway protein G
MLVVIIIGALVAMVLPRLSGRTEQARIQAGQADIRSNIATALKLYELDNGSFPSTSEGLNALLNKSGDMRNWNGPYLEKKPIDPWGREYKYESPGGHRTQDYDLYSTGKDGQSGTADDITNWD